MKKYLISLLLVITALCANAQITSTQLKDLNGKTIPSDNILNNSEEPIVLCFWATWCRPCLQELEAINEAIDDWRDKVNFKMVAISIDNTRSSSKVPALVKARDWQFDFYIDENSDLKRALNVSGVPFCCIIKKGEIVWKHSGYQPGSEELILEKLTELSKK